MKLNRYKNYMKESNVYSHDNLEDAKDEIEKHLDGYKNFLASKIKFREGELTYSELLDIPVVLKEIEKDVDTEYIKVFNVEAFLRKVNQILELKERDTKRQVRDTFNDYYQSMDKRIETLSGEDKEETTYDKFYDVWEGEDSVISRDQYDKEKFNIQVELLKLQEYVKKEGKKVVIVFEGRDAAGKGSTIKRFTEYLDPKSYNVVALGIPTEEEKNNWFGRYEKFLPKEGEIVFFDRSWYNRAVVEPTMRYCSEEQYKDFMDRVIPWEESLIDKGVILIKFWFSITKEKQEKRFELRQKSPLKYWKFSPNDAKVVNQWDLITYYKNVMFNKTSTKKSPWVIINSNDKRIGRLNAMRYVLNVVDYPEKNEKTIQYYPEVVNVLK
jgi:polyphosphate kinase 2